MDSASTVGEFKSDFETMVESMVESLRKDFERFGIRAEYRITEQGVEEDLWAEFRILLWDISGGKKNDLADVLEFHIIKQGKPALTLSEAENWLRENLTDILGRGARL